MFLKTKKYDTKSMLGKTFWKNCLWKHFLTINYIWEMLKYYLSCFRKSKLLNNWKQRIKHAHYFHMPRWNHFWRKKKKIICSHQTSSVCQEKEQSQNQKLRLKSDKTRKLEWEVNAIFKVLEVWEKCLRWFRHVQQRLKMCWYRAIWFKLKVLQVQQDDQNYLAQGS